MALLQIKIFRRHWQLGARLCLVFLGCSVAERAPAAPPAGYYLVWGDEFNGTSLDTTKWDYWLLGPRRDAVNVTNAVSVSGGNLIITTYTTNGTHYTAMVATDNTFRSRYGYWESSIAWGDTNGMWSAFWMQSPTMGTYLNDAAVSGSEIDIVEHRWTDGGSVGDINNIVQNNIHWNGYGASAASAGSGNIGSGLGAGYHTYALLWTPSVYTIFVDGSNLRSWNFANNHVPISESTEWTILSSEVDDTSTTWAGTIPLAGYGNLGASTTQLKVDYVRYYAPTNTLFWTGASSAYWTNSANWVSNMVPGSIKDLTFSYLSGNLNSQLGQDFSVDSLVFLNMNNGASVNGTNMLTLGAGGIDMVSANHSVTINCPVTIGAGQTWQVGPNNPGNTLTDSGNISGTSALSKGSYGVLVLNGTNNFSGALNVDTGSTVANDGFLRIASSAAVAAAVSPISIRNNNSGSSTLQLDGSLGSVVLAQNISLAGRNTNVVAIANFAGSNTITGNLILVSGGGNYWLDSDSGTLNFAGLVPASTPGGTRTVTLMGSGNILISGELTNGAGGGTVIVSKSGTGTLTLNNGNAYTGGTALAQGVIQANASGAFGPGTITANPGNNTARLILGNGVTITNALNAISVNSGSGNLGLVMVNDNTSAMYSGPIAITGNATTGGHFCGPTTSGLLTIAGPVTANPTNVLIMRAGNVRFSGGGNYTEIQARVNTLSLGANNGLAANTAVDIAGNGSTVIPTSLDLNGFDQALAGVKNSVNSAEAAWVTNSSLNVNTLTLNTGTTNFLFGGSIVGPIALTLNGGTQVLTKTGISNLNGLYTYTGPTTINGGRLVLGNGMALPNTPFISLGAGATLDASATGLVLGTAQTLSGNGTVLGDLSVNGTLTPGGEIGILTCSNNVTLTAGSTNIFVLNKTLGTNSQLQVSGTLVYGGILMVTNLSGTLVGGDSFQLCNAGSAAGTFAAIAGSPGRGLDWKFNPTNGVLTIYSTVPASLSAGISGGGLQLTWPSDHRGWTLLAQTNNMNVGLGTNWFPLPGSEVVTQYAAPLDLAEPCVFYRLFYQ